MIPTRIPSADGEQAEAEPAVRLVEAAAGDEPRRRATTCQNSHHGASSMVSHEAKKLGDQQQPALARGRAR